MIQDILPSKLDNQYDVREPKRSDLMVFIQGGKLLCRITDGTLHMPTFEEARTDDARYLVSVDGTAFFTPIAPDSIAPDLTAPDSTASDPLAPDSTALDSTASDSIALLKEKDYEFHPIGDLRGCTPKWLCFGSLTAFSYASWYEKNRFCGRCGSHMVHSDKERAMVCPQCSNLVYPKICPVVIVGVINGDTILLTKYKNKMNLNRYALIAGFAEIGESIEQTVAREVMEETGIRVKNLKFYKSQPWAFSDSLLMGFYCEEDGDDEARPDGEELGFASWMTRDKVPAMQDDVSLTSEMMGRFRELGRAVLD